MKEKFRQMMETSAKQSTSSGSLSYWIGSAIVALTVASGDFFTLAT
ncbi:hypothetical protein [Lacticaseibacillus sp. N501-2]